MYPEIGGRATQREYSQGSRRGALTRVRSGRLRVARCRGAGWRNCGKICKEHGSAACRLRGNNHPDADTVAMPTKTKRKSTRATATKTRQGARPRARDASREIARERERRALLLAGDVTRSAFCREAVDRTVREPGRLDVLVNNAAYQHNVDSIADLSEDQWDRTFRTNIHGYFCVARAAIPHMTRGAAIINAGSITGLEGSKDLLDCSATKGAIHAFTKSLAQNLVEQGIRVNCVAPGPVWTPLNVRGRFSRCSEEKRRPGECGSHGVSGAEPGARTGVGAPNGRSSAGGSSQRPMTCAGLKC